MSKVITAYETKLTDVAKSNENLQMQITRKATAILDDANFNLEKTFRHPITPSPTLEKDGGGLMTSEQRREELGLTKE